MLLNVVVNNLTNFGAFCDMGIKESGLIHISQITDDFIKDPSEKLFIGQQLQAKVLQIDVARKRVGLTLKF